MSVAELAYVAETTRKDRAHNIAIAILKLKDGENHGARTRMIRRVIREELGLPILEGEAMNGDLRAHGDALGKHELFLDVLRKTVQGKTERVVMFTEENVKKCEEYLEKNGEDQEKIL